MRKTLLASAALVVAVGISMSASAGSPNDYGKGPPACEGARIGGSIGDTEPVFGEDGDTFGTMASQMARNGDMNAYRLATRVANPPIFPEPGVGFAQQDNLSECNLGSNVDPTTPD